MTLEQREKRARLSRLQELRQQREQNTTGFNVNYNILIFHNFTRLMKI